MKKKDAQGFIGILFLAIFLLSFTLFSYEILLTRLFSVILSHNLVFLVVSFAILGSGIGGIFTYRYLANKQHKDTILLKWATIIFPLSIIGTILFAYTLPYSSIFIVYSLIGMIPFVIGGSILSVIFMRCAKSTSTMYFFDLFGGALGSIMVIQLMDTFGFMTSFIIIALTAFVFSLLMLCFLNEKKTKSIPIIGLVLLIALLFQSTLIKKVEDSFSAYYTSPNVLLQYLNNSKEKLTGIAYSKWNSISRMDVIETTNLDEKIIVTDGGASAPMLKFDGNLKKIEYLKNEINFIPFTFGKNDKTLVIGSGGGKDVLFALLGESKDISAVEINATTVEAVKQFSEYNGNIYERPEVSVFIQDGRRFINNSKDKFDNIYLSMVMTNAIENKMFSLSENYLFTEEAFYQYFDKLKLNGKLSFMTHNLIDMVKILNTGIKVLIDEGVNINDLNKYFVIVNGLTADQIKTHGNMVSMPLIIFKKTPFTTPEIDIIKDITAKQKREMLHAASQPYDIYNMLDKKDITYDAFLKEFKINVKPTRDDNPFFYNYSNFIPKEILIIGLGVIIIWVFIKKLYFKDIKTKKVAQYFNLIGLSFMMVEVTFVQKTSLYFGSSALAFSSILAIILTTSGFGSLLSGSKFVRKHVDKSANYLLLLVFSIVSTLLVLDQTMQLSSEANLITKIIIMTITLLPMGLLLGLPFPTGIRKINESHNETIIPLMWGSNGIFSVLGSILAMGISMKFGFNVTILSAAFLYFVLFVINPLKN